MHPDPPSGPPAPIAVDLAHERAELERARGAAAVKLARLATLPRGGGADAIADEYIDAVVAGAVDQLQRELVVFGRIDDDQPWRVGLFGLDADGDQLVVDWRAPFAGAFYQATFDDPMGLARRVSYVGCIDDLFVEDFAAGDVAGSSPLLHELSRERGTTMRTAVATLQSEQDRLVRLDPAARLVLRGGPGTGKTVVGLHRAAWLVYNDTRVTADRILVLGPSERFLRFVSAVLPTLGEAKVAQTTFERLLGPSTPAGNDEAWVDLLDRFEAGLCRPREIRVRGRIVPEGDVAELVDRVGGRPLPWRDRRRVFVQSLARRTGLAPAEIVPAVDDVFPSMPRSRAWSRLTNRRVLQSLGAAPALVDAWLADPVGGALADEVRARFEGVPARYAHVIVDEAQDASLLQLRAVMRRSEGVTLVGDDAQRSDPSGVGLARGADLLGVPVEAMTTAYRMSAEIAEWLNHHARRHGLDAVELVGIRPTGVPVREEDGARAVEEVVAELGRRWANVAVIGAGEVWDHKGVEYDAVVVRRAGLTPREVYLAASRAAHELVVTG